MKCDLLEAIWRGTALMMRFADGVAGERARYSGPVDREIVRRSHRAQTPGMNGFLATLLVAVLGLGGVLIGKL
jgi:hypothetical protein